MVLRQGRCTHIGEEHLGLSLQGAQQKVVTIQLPFLTKSKTTMVQGYCDLRVSHNISSGQFGFW